MDSSMRACGVNERRSGALRARAGRGAARRAARAVVLALALLPLSTPAATLDERGRFDMRGVEVRSDDDVYRINAIARLELSAAARRALDNGVTLIIALEVRVLRERNWWFDETVAEVGRRTRLERHGLSGQYVVTNLNTDERRSFYDLDRALEVVGRAMEFPVIDAVLVDDPARYRGRARMRLEREALPWAMRPLTLFNGDWKLRTDWFEWSFD